MTICNNKFNVNYTQIHTSTSTINLTIPPATFYRHAQAYNKCVYNTYPNIVNTNSLVNNPSHIDPSSKLLNYIPPFEDNEIVKDYIELLDHNTQIEKYINTSREAFLVTKPNKKHLGDHIDNLKENTNMNIKLSSIVDQLMMSVWANTAIIPEYSDLSISKKSYSSQLFIRNSICTRYQK